MNGAEPAALDAAQFFCPKCSAEIAATDAVCPRCGTSLIAGPAAAEKRDMLDNPWVVLGMLFLATGVLGLPFLWRSKGFSPLAKVIVGVAVTIYTALLVWLAALAVMWAWRNAQPALGHLMIGRWLWATCWPLCRLAPEAKSRLE